MRVEKPRFFGLKVACDDCPWADADGTAVDGDCSDRSCPRPSDYAEQCRLAEQAEKGE